MNKEIAKEGFELAEKEAREKQVREVKEIVLKTLEKLENINKEIGVLKEEKKILEMDINDLKMGKIDRIVERQDKDPKAKDTSVVVIIREKETIREVSPWYWPYRVVWNEPYTPAWYTSPAVFCNSTAGAMATTQNSFDCSCDGTYTPTINCSVAKDFAIGTYEVNGHPVHLR